MYMELSETFIIDNGTISCFFHTKKYIPIFFDTPPNKLKNFCVTFPVAIHLGTAQ